jgi:hypothetical protein
MTIIVSDLPVDGTPELGRSYRPQRQRRRPTPRSTRRPRGGYRAIIEAKGQDRKAVPAEVGPTSTREPATAKEPTKERSGYTVRGRELAGACVFMYNTNHENRAHFPIHRTKGRLVPPWRNDDSPDFYWMLDARAL